MTVAIVGAGALGRIVANIVREESRIAFFDDDESRQDTVVLGYPVRGPVRSLLDRSPSDYEPIVAVGDVEVRQRLYRTLVDGGFSPTTAVHPTASVAPSAEIGDGTIVKDQATIEPGATIGENAIVGNNATVCHDTVVGSHARLAPGVTIAGHASVGNGAYLAVDVSVDSGISVGEDSIVASGCTLWKDVPASATVKLPAPMEVEER